VRSVASIAVGAGFLFVTLAMFVQGVLPSVIPESRTRQVTRAVRTDLGDLKWVRYDASDYTATERRGTTSILGAARTLSLAGAGGAIRPTAMKPAIVRSTTLARRAAAR